MIASALLSFGVAARIVLVLFLLTLLPAIAQEKLAAAAGPPTTFQRSVFRGVVTNRSVGSVLLGMTVGQACKALPGFTLNRTSDGEGIALIAVKQNGNIRMTLYAGEPNPEARIDERASIEFIEVWDAGYRTAEGVYPSMPLPEVERKYGKLKEITLTEIESREYATFVNQPAGIQFRVISKNGTAGIYGEGQSQSTSYTPTSYVFSISIRKIPRQTPRFSSSYTDLKTQCKNRATAGDEGQHVSSFCKGYGEYRIHIFDSAMALHLNAVTLDGKNSIALATQSLSYDRQGRRIEWRVADGKPFAVILRVFKYSGKGEYPLQEKPTGEVLLVKGLTGFEHIDQEIDFKGSANPNAKARALADSSYARPL